MYKLPQLPHDQLQAFVCELFNQMMVISDIKYFKISGKWIHSSRYNISILTIPLDIELSKKDAWEKLKEETETEIISQNIDTDIVIVATNYPLETTFQTHMEGILYPNDFYLDWQGISILADNPEFQFDFHQFYPNLNFKKLPHKFINGKEELNYYQKGSEIISKIFGERSIQFSYFHGRLLKIYEKQDFYLDDIYLDPNLSQKLPYAIKQIQIENFHCIKKIVIEAIPVDAQWIFITGKNGTGKSSILQALVIGLLGDFRMLLSQEQQTTINTELLQNGKGQINNFTKKGRQEKLSKTNTDNIGSLSVLAYGASRLRIQSEQVLEQDFNQDNTYSLFYPTAGNLMNIEPWIKDAKLNKENQKIKLVQDVLCKLAPSIDKINIDGSVINYIENGFVTPLEHLASGNRSILAMVGDMLIRFYHFFPKAKKTTDFKGIVLIDELDLHLHPEWQRELPWKLSEIFPNVQFICTTHSLVPLMGAPRRSVFFTMDRTKDEGSTIQKLDLDVPNLSADILLTSPLFGVPLFSKVAESEDNIQGYRTESDYESYFKKLQDDEKFIALQKKYGNIFGDNLFKK